jgi:hypothetical protein
MDTAIPAPRPAPDAEGDGATDRFYCENCERDFADRPHATADGYWLCHPCWNGLRIESGRDPVAGEWRYTPLEVKTPNVPPRWLITSEDHWPIAETYSEQDAAQIVRDHSAVPKLIEALQDAMKIVADKAAGGKMLTTQKEAKSVWGRCAAALASTQGRIIENQSTQTDSKSGD